LLNDTSLKWKCTDKPIEHISAFPANEASAPNFIWSSSQLCVYETAKIVVVCSGRLWNRAQLLSRFSSESSRASSDAQNIADLYLRKGIRILKQLDGVSVTILDITKKTAMLFRDWIGVSTFYYSTHEGVLRVASSRKLFRHLFPSTAGGVIELHAGFLLKFSAKAGSVRVLRLQEVSKRRSRHSFATATSKVRRLVAEAVRARILPGRSAVLLSGGVDSTILAYLLKAQGVRYEAFTFSLSEPLFPVEDGDFDLFAARKAANWLQVPLHEVLVTADILVKSIETAIYVAESRRSTLIDEMCGMLLTAQSISTKGISQVYSGESADMMFGSPWFILRFIHKRGLANFAREMIELSVPTAVSTLQRIYWHAGKIELVFPYMHKPLVNYALSLPVEYRIDKARFMKVVLRQAFEGEIPDEFLYRRKGITRETTHVRYALENALGRSPYRYYTKFRELFGSRMSDQRKSLAIESLS
jgi:asparagine synthase (glutamine-hydrolysing)